MVWLCLAIYVACLVVAVIATPIIHKKGDQLIKKRELISIFTWFGFFVGSQMILIDAMFKWLGVFS